MPDPNPNPNPAPNPTPNPTPSPAPAAVVNADGTYAADWLKHPAVPEELRTNAQLATHKSLADTLKNWATLEKIRGHQVVPVPAEGSDEATWGLVWDRLGRPKDAAGYTIPSLAASGIDPQHQAPPEFIAEVTKIAHAAGLTQRQFGTLLTGWNQLVGNSLKARDAKAVNDRSVKFQALAQQWPGQTFAANKALAEKFLRATVPADKLPALMGLLDDPDGLAWVHGLAVKLGELEPDLDTALVPVGAAAAAQAELDKLIANVNGALYDDQHPEHKQVLKRFQALTELVGKARAARQQ